MLIIKNSKLHYNDVFLLVYMTFKCATYCFSIICFILLNTNLLFSQTIVEKNLVPNGSLENFKSKGNSIASAVPWSQLGTVDLYRKPISNDTGRYKGARSGEAYAGLRNQKNYKEFMQVKLAEPLHRGYKYKFEMYIRLAFWSDAILKSIGVSFSKVGYSGNGPVDKNTRIDTVCKKGGLHGGYDWMKVSGIYQADGGEKFITIGNFQEKIQKDMERIGGGFFGFKEAYYFIDDISLKLIRPKEDDVKTVVVGSTFEQDSVLQVKKDIKVGDKVTLKNINFEKGHSYITPESFVELNKLVQYMLRHPGIEIRINGHSDNTGLEFKNQRISEQRAKAVFVYLISKGVQNKMYFKGFGSKQPIADNDSEEGMFKNRRVEFEIIKQ